MRPELELLQQIENYLLGKMNEADKLVFEEKMKADANLRTEVEKQMQVMEAVKRSGVRSDVRTAGKKYFLRKNIFKWGLGGAGLLAATLVVMFMSGGNPFNSTDNTDPYYLPELNERNEKVWADADKYLPSQYFSIDNSKDTVIETEGGIVFAIPKGVFLDESGHPVTGNVKLNVKEALKPEDIVKGGMDTRSDGKLLETGGMFYLNPTQGGKNLKIDASKGIYTEVPTDKQKPGMQLFEGQRMPDGSINWKNPRPAEKFLTPVDITTLNFYPPLYLDSLKRMGYDVKDKKFTDSLYYSFARFFSPVNMTNKDSARSNSDVVPAPSANSPDTYTSDSGPDKLTLDGKRLFRANCMACHFLDSRVSTAPGFAGISTRHSKEFSFRYTKNWMEMVKSGNAEAIKTSQSYPNTMTIFEGTLTDEEVKAIVDYIYAQPSEYKIEPHSSIPFGEGFHGINPAKIKTIWNREYDNTLLATKEFEARLPFIFKTCKEEILDLYINNLNKRLSGIDSIAAGMDAHMHDQFMQFASRNDGRVKITEGHLKKLQEYYQKKARAYTEAITKTQEKFWKQQGAMDEVALQKLNDHNSKNAKIEQENFTREYEKNVEDAYRQLGIKHSFVPAEDTYGATIAGAGWWNLDQEVYASTQSRTSMEYTDPNSGKTAKIIYQPFTLKVGGSERWDRLTAFLLPDSLYSFQRMKQEGFEFKESLNTLLKYDLVSIGYKGSDIYYFEAKNVQQGELQADWKKISAKDLDEKLSMLKSRTYKKDILEEADYTRFEIMDEKRRVTNYKLDELTSRIRPVIFPCAPSDYFRMAEGMVTWH
jgi:mono/diheme cytochrome c family protein